MKLFHRTPEDSQPVIVADEQERGIVGLATLPLYGVPLFDILEGYVDVEDIYPRQTMVDFSGEL